MNNTEFYKIYISGNDNKVEESMALWTQMQEEDIQPSDHFMWSLSELLIKNNVDVPFTIEKPVEKVISSVPSDVNNNLSSQLNMCLQNNNITKALGIRKIMHSKNLNINSTIESRIIELLLRENRLDEGFEVAKNMLETSRPITKNVLQFLIGTLSETGNIAKLEYLEEKLSKV